MSRTLLLDSDIVAFKFAATAEQPLDWGDGVFTLHAQVEPAVSQMTAYIDGLMITMKADRIIVALTDEANFRYVILPSYKSNRKGVRRPMILRTLKDHLAGNYECFQRPGLEADDCLGILSTSTKIVKGEKVIVSEDKDMRQIPGMLYNPGHPDDGIIAISEAEGGLWHMMQTLTGDPTDGYAGCPGCGPVKAAKILGAVDPVDHWKAVVTAYKAAGLGESVALQMAQVSRICRVGDYDFKRKAVKPWRPTNSTTA